MTGVTPMMTGHCSFPATERKVGVRVVPVPASHSHEVCAALGAGSTSSTGTLLPCPCSCHLAEDEFECGECGGVLRVAPHWPNDYRLGDDNADPDEEVYVHVDPDTGRATGEWC